jgi:hypothetical protein
MWVCPCGGRNNSSNKFQKPNVEKRIYSQAILEPKISPSSPGGFADTEVRSLVESLQFLDLLLGEVDKIRIGFR